MKPSIHIVEIAFFHYIMSSSDLPKFSTTSVKPVHKYYLYTDFTEVVEHFGRSDYDMV